MLARPPMRWHNNTGAGFWPHLSGGLMCSHLSSRLALSSSAAKSSASAWVPLCSVGIRTRGWLNNCDLLIAPPPAGVFGEGILLGDADVTDDLFVILLLLLLLLRTSASCVTSPERFSSQSRRAMRKSDIIWSFLRSLLKLRVCAFPFFLNPNCGSCGVVPALTTFVVAADARRKDAFATDEQPPPIPTHAHTAFRVTMVTQGKAIYIETIRGSVKDGAQQFLLCFTYCNCYKPRVSSRDASGSEFRHAPGSMQSRAMEGYAEWCIEKGGRHHIATLRSR